MIDQRRRENPVRLATVACPESPACIIYIPVIPDEFLIELEKGLNQVYTNQLRTPPREGIRLEPVYPSLLRLFQDTVIAVEHDEGVPVVARYGLYRLHTPWGRHYIVIQNQKVSSFSSSRFEQAFPEIPPWAVPLRVYANHRREGFERGNQSSGHLTRWGVHDAYFDFRCHLCLPIDRR
jgi:hypothetical protein